MHLVLIASVITIALFAIARLFVGAEAQTRAFYRCLRWWSSWWPINRGRGLPRRLLPVLKPLVPVWVEVEPGIRMLLSGNDLVSRIILETGVWESSSWMAIEQHLSLGATFVDVGAHMGYFSLKAATAVGPSGRVIAIEPHPEMVRTLRDNIFASRATSVAVEPAACSDSETTLELFSAADSNSGTSSLSRKNASLYGSDGASYIVPAWPLDSIIERANVSRVDVLKIDVEGAELQVLKGAQETIARYHPVLLIELDDRLLESMGTSSAEIIGFLSDHGYSLRRSYDEANFEFCPKYPSPQIAFSVNQLESRE